METLLWAVNHPTTRVHEVLMVIYGFALVILFFLRFSVLTSNLKINIYLSLSFFFFFWLKSSRTVSVALNQKLRMMLKLVTGSGVLCVTDSNKLLVGQKWVRGQLNYLSQRETSSNFFKKPQIMWITYYLLHVVNRYCSWRFSILGIKKSQGAGLCRILCVVFNMIFQKWTSVSLAWFLWNQRSKPI